MTPGPYRTQGSVARTLGSIRCAGCSTALERDVVCFSGEGDTVCQGCFRLECATNAANQLRMPRVRPAWGAGRFMCGLFLCFAGQHVIFGRAFFLVALAALVIWGITRTAPTR